MNANESIMWSIGIDSFELEIQSLRVLNQIELDQVFPGYRLSQGSAKSDPRANKLIAGRTCVLCYGPGSGPRARLCRPLD